MSLAISVAECVGLLLSRLVGYRWMVVPAPDRFLNVFKNISRLSNLCKLSHKGVRGQFPTPQFLLKLGSTFQQFWLVWVIDVKNVNFEEKWGPNGAFLFRK